MKNILLILALLFATSSFVIAQEAVQGRYALTKKVAEQAPGMAILIDGSEEYVTAALTEKFVAADSKAKAKNMGKGLYKYEAIVLPEVSDATLNYYYRIEEGGNPGATMTKVTFFISPGHDNFYTADKYSTELNAAERMLVSLDKGAKRMAMQAAVEAQAALIATEEKQQADLEKTAKQLTKEQSDIEKEIEKLQKKLVENQSNIEKNTKDREGQTMKIAKEVEKLQDLRKQLTDF